MNKRRWIAVGIAVVLVIFSALSSTINKKEANKEELSQVNELLYGTGEPQEKVEEAGSSKADCFQLEATIMLLLCNN